IPLVYERINKLEDFMDYAGFFFTGDLALSGEAVSAMVFPGADRTGVAKAIGALLEERLDTIMEWESAVLEEAVRGFCEEKGLEAKNMFMALRVAVTGRQASPPLFDTMEVLGKEVCRRRLRAAVDTLRRS
ncbi:hypothetical protein JW921_03180, partial [Candidatus Fermentibacterales bacterium]|nr:hypothetical protein [Candidatus Fermentibacterales bacterium]